MDFVDFHTQMNNQPYSNRTRMKIITAKEAAIISKSATNTIQYLKLQRISQAITITAERGERNVIITEKELDDDSIRHLRDLGYAVFFLFNGSESYSICW